jgi:hypothetical protein
MDRKTPHERLSSADRQDIEAARQEFVRHLLAKYGEPGDRLAHGDPYRGHEYSRRASQLMREWNPIGFSRHAVRSVMGEPLRDSDELLVFRFTVGPAVRIWEFEINARGDVEGVRGRSGI